MAQAEMDEQKERVVGSELLKMTRNQVARTGTQYRAGHGILLEERYVRAVFWRRA